MWTIKKKIYYILYTIIGKKLPVSRRCKWGGRVRYYFAKRILKQIGKNVNIEKDAYFNPMVSVGDNSGIGINCELYGEVEIGKNVLMGPECIFYTNNHNFIDKNVLIKDQGMSELKKIVIEDDCWLGRRVIVLPGIRIKKGTVVGAGSVLTKTFPEYSVVAGNPAKIIKERK